MVYVMPVLCVLVWGLPATSIANRISTTVTNINTTLPKCSKFCRQRQRPKGLT